jgi:uncharacterized membrane protein (UPF0127 family)
MIDITLGNK